MGHRAGWLALGSGIARGADVILLPEIPYDLETVAEAIPPALAWRQEFLHRGRGRGRTAPGDRQRGERGGAKRKATATSKKEKKEAKETLAKLAQDYANHTVLLSSQLEELTGLESRVTILGHLQRGGTPSAADRLLATRLGTACADLINEGSFGVMVAARGDDAVPSPWKRWQATRSWFRLDHPWVNSARHVGTCLGDTIDTP